MCGKQSGWNEVWNIQRWVKGKNDGESPIMWGAYFTFWGAYFTFVNFTVNKLLKSTPAWMKCTTAGCDLCEPGQRGRGEGTLIVYPKRGSELRR